MDWSPPAPDGKQTCPSHPESGRFGDEGCTACEAGTSAEAVTLGEGESLVAAAALVGLPTGLQAEMWAWADYEFANARKAKLAGIADELLDNSETLELGLKAEMVAAKWGDTAAKLEKLAKVDIGIRERMAAKEKRDRLLESIGAGT